jgi:neutral ceramidase
LAIARLGPLTIATLPVEMTTTAGWRIRKALAAQEVPRRVVVVGLANEYLSYVTTAEEYEEQDYEGASTIFGEKSADCFLRRLVALAQTQPVPQLQVGSATFPAGVEPLRLQFGPMLAPPFRGTGDEELLAPFASGDLPSDRWPRFAWTEPAENDWKTERRRITIFEKEQGTWRERHDADGPDDDQGTNLLTVQQGATKTTREWLVFWIPPREPPATLFRFRVITPDGQTLESPPFSIGGGTP